MVEQRWRLVEDDDVDIVTAKRSDEIRRDVGGYPKRGRRGGALVHEHRHVNIARRASVTPCH